jgi:hypothetical protein
MAFTSLRYGSLHRRAPADAVMSVVEAKGQSTERPRLLGDAVVTPSADYTQHEDACWTEDDEFRR